MLIVVFFISVWPVFIPLIFSFLFGLLSRGTGLKRLLQWLLINYVLSILCGVLVQYFARYWCGIDGGSPCNVDIEAYLNFSLYISLFLTLLGLPLMYLGVWIRHLLHSRKRKA